MMIEQPKGITTIISNTARAADTARFMHEIVRKTHGQLAPLALRLQVIENNGLAILPTLQNTDAWIRKNIKYVKDAETAEQLHSPARLYAQRYGDCDDMSIFTGALLTLWKIPFSYRIVSYTTKNAFVHIFTVVPTKEGLITIDCVPEARFNWTPPYKHFQDFPN